MLIRNAYLMRAGGGNPYAGYAVALDFKNRIYSVNDVLYANLSDIPEYAASTAPTLVANGLSVPDNRTLSFTINPVTTDQDFIMWGVANHSATTAGQEVYLTLGSGAGYLISGRAPSGGGDMYANANGTQLFSGAVVGTGRGIALYRRRAGKNTAAGKSGSVSIGTEDAGTAFPSLTTTLNVGNFAGGGLPANATIEGVYLRQGTFSDANLNSILTAA